MSKQAFDAFKAKLLEDRELREQMERTLGARGSVDEVVAFAKARGYDFEAEHVPQGVELSDEQLEGVAGGTGEYRVKVKFPWLSEHG